MTIDKHVWRILIRSRVEGECYVWHGAIAANGYGRITFRGVDTTVHRAAYELANGPIPVGLQVDHLCRNRACWRPSHLEAVTQRENLLRGEGATGTNARKTECVHGHPFDDANTYRNKKDGTRQCRACNRDKANRRYAAIKAKREADAA